MTDQPRRTDVPSSDPAPTPRRSGGARFWLIPAVAFLLGVLLGAVVIGVTKAGDTGNARPAAASSTTPSPSPSAGVSADRTVTVPASCLAAADRAEQALGVVSDGVRAIRNLDAAAVRRVLTRLDQLQPAVRKQADQCRAAATEQVTP